MSSMAKQEDSRSCFITRGRVFYKCVQLVQGEIMLISITIIPLFNFEKNISYVFLFPRNFKISFPSVFTVYLVLFQREKTLQLTSINLVYMRLSDLRRIALRESPWRVAPEKQSLKQYNATISKYINLIFCYVI